MPTYATAITRAAERLYYKGDDGAVIDGVGKIEASFVQANTNAARQGTIVALSDGGAAGDKIELLVDASDDVTVTTAKTAGDAGSATVAGDFSTGLQVKAVARYRANVLNLNVNGVDATTDVDCDIPVNIDQIEIGGDASGANDLNGHITKVVIYSR